MRRQSTPILCRRHKSLSPPSRDWSRRSIRRRSAGFQPAAGCENGGALADGPLPRSPAPQSLRTRAPCSPSFLHEFAPPLAVCFRACVAPRALCPLPFALAEFGVRDDRGSSWPFLPPVPKGAASSDVEHSSGRWYKPSGSRARVVLPRPLWTSTPGRQWSLPVSSCFILLLLLRLALSARGCPKSLRELQDGVRVGRRGRRTPCRCACAATAGQEPLARLAVSQYVSRLLWLAVRSSPA